MVVMIVIEGPDGSGKTTLVNQFLSQFPDQLKLGERTGEDDERADTVFSDTLHAMARAVRMTQNVYIYDRLWPSELVYSKVFGRECSISDEQAHYLRRLDAAAGWPLVICLPPKDVVKEQAMKSPQMEGVVDKIDHLWDEYFNTGRGYWIYDWTRPGRFNQLLGHVEEYLWLREKRRDL